MLWPDHLLCGYLGGWILSHKHKRNMDVVIGSILPDLPMVVFLWHHHWHVDEVTCWDVQAFYFLPHSLLVLPLIPPQWRLYYGLHILCDMVAHTAPWGIRPLFPFSSVAVHGYYDPWKLLHA